MPPNEEVQLRLDELHREQKAASASAPAIRELVIDDFRKENGDIKELPAWLFNSWARSRAPRICIGDKPVYIPAKDSLLRAVGFKDGRVLVRDYNRGIGGCETQSYDFEQLQPVLVHPMPMEGELVLVWNTSECLADIRYAFRNEQPEDSFRSIRAYRSPLAITGQKSELYENWYPFCPMRVSKPPMFWDAVTEWPEEGLCFVSAELDLILQKRKSF